MRVGVLCEFSGVVRDAFIARGHDAISCDLLPTEAPGPHIQGDCLAQDWGGFDLLICHPPCTYLCNSGVRWLWNGKRSAGSPSPRRWQGMAEGRSFFLACLELCRKVGRGVCENPIPHGHADLPPYDQLIQPWYFGDPQSKATCLWLVGLPPLRATHIDALLFGIEGPKEIGTMIHDCPPGPNRSRIRSATFPGVAKAFAAQWGSLPQESPHA